MTKRRLINKKAYDEMLLLKKLTKRDNENNYVVSIQVDENGNEGFMINHIYRGEFMAEIVIQKSW